jgi:hypothetical protein
MCFIVLTEETELLSIKQAKNMKQEYSKVTSKSLQQKEVHLPLVPYCTNNFKKGLFGFPLPLISRWNINSFISTQISHCSN